MIPENIVGHSDVLQKFQRWVSNRRLANTYLLAGPEGIGKRTTALWLAKALLCETTPDNEMIACQTCSACQQVDAMSHPDLLYVNRPADKNRIPIELLIGSREERMRAGLCHDIALKPYRGGRRIAIIDDADFLNQEGANCLLKTLEEPPASSTIFLISNSEHRQLATIRSRSQIVRFQPLQASDIQKILTQQGQVPEGVDQNQLALACDGSLQLAYVLCDPDTMEFRRSWLEQLATADPGREDFADSISSFVDAAGKEAAMKRDRLRLVAQLATQFYRNLMLQQCGHASVTDETMNQSVAAAALRWPSSAATTANCVQRCGLVREHVLANANQALVIESFLSDLGRITRGEI